MSNHQENAATLPNQKNSPIDGFVPLSLSNSYAIWTFSGIKVYESKRLSLRVNDIGGEGFVSIQITDHEALTLARALTRILKTIMNKDKTIYDDKARNYEERGARSALTNIPITQRQGKSLALSYKKGAKSVTLHLNGSIARFLEISLEKAQLLRLKNIELLTLCYPMVPAQFLADELLVSINS